MLEAEVHQWLREYLRSGGTALGRCLDPAMLGANVPAAKATHWRHQLTMARLVARALRLGRHTLVQTGLPAEIEGRHRLSYLVPALMWRSPAILVVPAALHTVLLQEEIPALQRWLPDPAPVLAGDRFPHAGFAGVVVTSLEVWLRDRLEGHQRFPLGVPAIVDGADDLEALALDCATAKIHPEDWNQLSVARPHLAESIRDLRVRLTWTIFQHPPNPYDCFLLDAPEQTILHQFAELLQAADSIDPIYQPYATAKAPAQPLPWQRFWQRYGDRTGTPPENRALWAQVDRQRGQFSLYCGPADAALSMTPLWQQQPVVLVGGNLDADPDATAFRQRLGLSDATCVQFALEPQEAVEIYLCDWLPLPNTDRFQPALTQTTIALLAGNAGRWTQEITTQGIAVVLTGDRPLQSQLGAALAAEFGSRVQVEKTAVQPGDILVTGWRFWREHQASLPAPDLLAICTLPIPSLEHPLVASRVGYYRRQHLNWFSLYLLPTAISELQRAIAPVRRCQGKVVLLDNRLLHRSYGTQILDALRPMQRLEGATLLHAGQAMELPSN